MMNDFCVVCQTAPATHSVTCIANGVPTAVYRLCAACIPGAHQMLVAKTKPVEYKCECGMTLEMFNKLQRVGCAKCYTALPIEQVLLEYHKTAQHVGKIPATATDPADVKKRIEMLEAAMKEAVVKEDYEQAARLRDKVKELQSKM